MALFNEIDSEKIRILENLKNFMEDLQSKQKETKAQIAKIQLRLIDPKGNKSKVKAELQTVQKCMFKVSNYILELEECQKKLATIRTDSNVFKEVNEKIFKIHKASIKLDEELQRLRIRKKEISLSLK